MDIRLMEFYLAVVRDGSISAAAENLHISQPALSRQMKELENFFGVKLFERSNRRIMLTEEGYVMKKRAEDVLSLLQSIQLELANVKGSVSGDIRIGGGETYAMHHMSMAIKEIMAKYPLVHIHIRSGDMTDMLLQLDNGLIDFLIAFNSFDHRLYDSINLPLHDTYGVLMRKDHRLANKKALKRSDLYGENVILSREIQESFLANEDRNKLNIVGTYNLLTNATFLVKDGVGIAVCIDHLVYTGESSDLVFIPFQPAMTVGSILIWKKYQNLNLANQLFIEEMRKEIENS